MFQGYGILGATEIHFSVCEQDLETGQNLNCGEILIKKGGRGMSLEETALSYLSEKRTLLISLARDIWDHPQVALRETYGSKKIADQLEKENFSVKRRVTQMPTAFIASWGGGGPIIGIFGEYDALPELSQKVSPEKEPVEQGGPGHGCGHNLLGVGSLGAAVAVKEAMEKNNIKGTIRYYGCPAEETLIGKIFMARDGVFDDLDAAITWHPFYTNSVWWSSSNAMNSFKINFHGLAAHAGDAPEAGRSALDAVLLTDVGVNYLREHIIQEARIHCVITNGGSVPNVVPAYAQIWYYVRAPRREQVEEICERVLGVARGAALMTGTTSDVEFITGCYNYLQNEVIGEIMTEKLKKIGPPKFTDEEKAFANQLIATLSPGEVEKTLRFFKLTREEAGDLCDKTFDQVGGLGSKENVIGGSTDIGDVSHITPTGQITTCCKPLGVAQHSWQNTASCGSSIGFKGMMVAAKVLALTVLDLMAKPDVLKAAQNEFKKVTGGKEEYKTPLPESTVAPV